MGKISAYGSSRSLSPCSIMLVLRYPLQPDQADGNPLLLVSTVGSSSTAGSHPLHPLRMSPMNALFEMMADSPPQGRHYAGHRVYSEEPVFWRACDGWWGWHNHDIRHHLPMHRSEALLFKGLVSTNTSRTFIEDKGGVRKFSTSI